MAVVKINAIEVPAAAGPELEKRFAARAAAVDGQPGFLGFELLRPVAGETRYFVVMHWASDADYRAWADGPRTAHDGNSGGAKLSTGANLLEFEVVDLSDRA